MDEAVAFGKVLRRLRKEAGLTQEQLGLEADLRRTYVSILELGQQQPSDRVPGRGVRSDQEVIDSSEFGEPISLRPRAS